MDEWMSLKYVRDLLPSASKHALIFATCRCINETDDKTFLVLPMLGSM